MPRRRPCICCKRGKRVNEQGFCPDCAICLHCEQRPSVHRRGLCATCHAEPGIRVLYNRRHGWTPEWEMHLRQKTAEVQRELKRESADGLAETLLRAWQAFAPEPPED